MAAQGGALREQFLHLLLANLDPTDVAFLTRIAILDHLHPDLCRRLVPKADAPERLARLARDTPVFAAGEASEWLRMHSLARDELRRTPTLLGVDKLLEAQLLDAPAERRQDLELAKTLVHQHTRGLAMYKCDNCGFRARQFYWHCPACAAWETYSPRRTEEAKIPA